MIKFILNKKFLQQNIKINKSPKSFHKKQRAFGSLLFVNPIEINY